MPQNFPEVWLGRVRTQLTTQDVAPWLDGIEELDTPVIELGSGSAGESNIIHVPISTFAPDVLINNTTYPIATQAYDDDTIDIKLDKYQTKSTTLSDDQVIGASYPKIDAATKSHIVAINSKKYAKAIHAIAPAANAAGTPVIPTTGEAINGRKRFTFVDLVSMKDAFDKLEVPEVGRRIVLSTDHWNDLLVDESNKAYNKLIVDFKTGQPAPIIAGFEVYSYISTPYFTTAGAKVAFAAVPGGTDNRASVAYYVGNIVKKTGLTKQYFAPANLDPENQTNRLNYRHYFITLPVMNKYIGAIYSAASA